MSKENKATSTVGRGKAVVLDAAPDSAHHTDDFVSLSFGNSLDFYKSWPAPTTIVSDGAYGVLGFEGDTSDHLDVPDWYEPHVKAWAESATPNTTLWFWNSEIGWAAAHPILEKYGWRYVNCNIWNKGVGHIAGNVNTQKIRRFPVVTEVCVQYVFEARIGGKPLKRWLLDEWKRTGMPQRKANEACGVKDAATRKYLDQGHLWYFPPSEAMQQLSDFANQFGDPAGRPYFSLDGVKPVSQGEWAKMRAKFNCPHGVTNVWERNQVRGEERVKVDGRAVHLNQKPLDIMKRIIQASTDVGDVVWEPFGGLFSGSLAARHLHRRAYAGEIDPTYYQYGVDRYLDGTRHVPLRHTGKGPDVSVYTTIRNEDLRVGDVIVLDVRTDAIMDAETTRTIVVIKPYDGPFADEFFATVDVTPGIGWVLARGGQTTLLSRS